jgi:lysophospholipase L1-like esterase
VWKIGNVCLNKRTILLGGVIPISKIDDIFYDISVGICGSQKFDINGERMVKDTKKFQKQYKPKTQLPNIIEGILNPFLEQVHKEYSWQYDLEFRSQDTNIRIIEYKPFSDYAIIQYDNEEPTRVSKKYVKELWEEREK